MDYLKIYNQLINKRQKTILEKCSEYYTERHHILPKCCGGTDKNDNLVNLTAKEHFIAHLLLLQIYKNTKYIGVISCAANLMLQKSSTQNRNSRITSRLYDKIKSNISKFKQKSSTGKKNPMYNKIWIHNTETKESKLINKNDIIPSGWKNGRFIVWKNRTFVEKVKHIRVKKQPQNTCPNCGNKTFTIYCNNNCKLEHLNKIKLSIYKEYDNIEYYPHVKSTGINRNFIKEYLIYKYGKICSICGKEYDIKDLVINTVDGNKHNTAKDNFKIVCKDCYKHTYSFSLIGKQILK